MSKAATWSIIVCFFFLALGFILRTILMMRSSDATPLYGRVLHGRDLQRQFRVRFPNSALPLLMRGALFGGLLLLLAGVTVVLSR
jgi:hypothetical protein